MQDSSTLPADWNISEDFVMVDHEDTCSRFFEPISQYLESLSDDLRAISINIHDNPELQYKELHAHKLLTEYMQKQQGWHVTSSAYNIETAFVAVFDSKKPGPVVSFDAEYDALKGFGHACGHNLIGVVSVGGALATARMMVENQEIGGKVVLFGTPAEEGGGGKIKLLDAGAYKDHNVDISLISHPGITEDAALLRTSAYSSFKVEYFGKASHAALAPWEGINALDALITAYNAISVLRQQTSPGDIIQGHITNGGARPNSIHAYSAGMFVVRSSTHSRRDALKKRLMKCFDAGAMATGATLQVTAKGSYDNHVPNKVLGGRFRSAFNLLGGHIPPEDIDYLAGTTMASTDQGNISYAMPSISPQFWIRSVDDNGQQLGGPHTPDFERAARSEEAHHLALRVSKALAVTAVDVLTTPKLLREAKREFDDMKKHEEC